MSRLPAIPPGIEVSSVGLVDSTGLFNVGNTPIVSQGNINLALLTQTANKVFAGPTSGSPAAPTMRALVAADIPAIDVTSGITGVLPVTNGGTGLSSALMTGAIMFAGSSSAFAQDNQFLFWSDSLYRMGLGGTTSPSQLLDLYNGHLRFTQITKPANTFHATPGVATGGTLSGTYLYAIASVTASGQTELSSTVSATVSGGTNNSVTVDTLPTPVTTDNVVHYNIYRSAAGGTALFFLTTVSIAGTFIDSGSVTPGSYDCIDLNNTTAGYFYLGSTVSGYLGGSNTSFGLGALTGLSGGSGNTAIGYQSGVSSGTINNSVAIGKGAIASANNTMALGGDGTTGKPATSVVICGTSAGAQLQVNAASAAAIGLIVNNGNSTPTGNLQQWQIAGTVVAAIDKGGHMALNAAATTANQLLIKALTTSTTGLVIDNPNTSPTADLQQWQSGGTSVARIDIAGNSGIAGKSVIGGSIAITDSQLHVESASSTTIGLVINSPTGLSVDLQRWRISATTIAAMSKSAALVLNGTSPTAQLDVNSADTSTVGLVVNNTHASATADLVQIKTGATTHATVDINGNLGLGGKAVVGGAISLANAQLHVEAANASSVGLIINNGNSTPTGDLQQWQIAGATKVAIDKSGRMGLNAAASTATQLLIRPTSASTTGIIVDNANATPTADLQQWQVGGSTLAKLDNDANFQLNGRMVVNGSLTGGYAQLEVYGSSVSLVGLLVRGMTGATNDLQRWQVGTTTKASISNDGSATVQDLSANGDASITGDATVAGQFSPNGAYVPGFAPINHGDSPYAVQVNGHYYLACNTNTGNIEVDLPTSGLLDGQVFTILDSYGAFSTGVITVVAGGSTKINGSGTLVSYANYACLVIRYTNVGSAPQWTIISNFGYN